MRNPCHSCGNMFKTTDRTETICEDCKKNPKPRSIQREPEVKRMEIPQLPESKVNQPQQVPLSPELLPDISFQPESKHVEISQSPETQDKLVDKRDKLIESTKPKLGFLRPRTYTPPNEDTIPDKDGKKHGTNKRRTVKGLERYLQYPEIRDRILNGKAGEMNIDRDRAMCAITYLGAMRISEVLKLNKRQWKPDAGLQKKDGTPRIDPVIVVKDVVLSKKRKLEKRDVELPISGERAELTEVVKQYVGTLSSEEDLFPITTSRAYMIIYQLTGGEVKNGRIIEVKGEKIGLFPHSLRAFGENYLLHHSFKKDGVLNFLGLAEYLHVSPEVLLNYLHDKDWLMT